MYRRVIRRKYRPRTYRKKPRAGTRRSAFTYRRTRKTFRRTMSKKRILNTTSRKKQDTMLSYTNTTAANPSGGAGFTNGPAILTGGNPYTFLWCATSRDLSNSSGGANILINRSERTATTCYMRGLAEKIRIQTTDGMPWQWRRVCFTLKGASISSLATSTNVLNTETNPGGWRRAVTNWSGYNPVRELMFRGTLNNDWIDPLTAPLDTNRISVKYDKSVTIAAGNEEGMCRTYKRWHPMNKNLVYSDDENGDGETSSGFSTTGRAGMGDYYVADFIYARRGATTSSQLSFDPEASLYWHEK